MKVCKIDNDLESDPYDEQYEVSVRRKEVYLHKVGKQRIEEIRVSRVKNEYDVYRGSL
jgi:hypothetical protein